MVNLSRENKRMAYRSLLLVGVLFFTCCSGGDYKIIEGGIQSTTNSMSGSYSDFSGFYYRRVRLEGNTNVVVDFHSKTRKGSIVFELLNSRGDVISKINENDSTNHRIHITQSAFYKFEVLGQDHKGSFYITWHLG